jgi:adenosylhomocysteine nucleosidase
VSREASARGVPFYCIRVISDEAGEDLPLDFNRFRKPDGRLSRARILAGVLQHPGKIPALMKLDRSANLASRALGEFLANCQY